MNLEKRKEKELKGHENNWAHMLCPPELFQELLGTNYFHFYSKKKKREIVHQYCHFWNNQLTHRISEWVLLMITIRKRRRLAGEIVDSVLVPVLVPARFILQKDSELGGFGCRLRPPLNFTIFKIALDVADQLKPSIGFFRMRNPPLMPSLDLYKQRTTIAENRFSVYLFLHLLLLRSSSLTHFKISPKRLEFSILFVLKISLFFSLVSYPLLEMKLCDSVTGQPLCFQSNDFECHNGGIFRHPTTVSKSEQCRSWFSFLSDVGIAAANRPWFLKVNFAFAFKRFIFYHFPLICIFKTLNSINLKYKVV